MDHSESSFSQHHCIDKYPDNSGQPNSFYTTRLCEKLTQPKGGFDLTDPNGYKLSTAYNCRHDPSLKTYLYRKDIHKRLLKNGLITKDDKVTCSFKEFNTYKKYLAEVQLDLDHRFKMEQVLLCREFRH
ncbi:fibrous sheath-interacting protein 2-like [Clupea harengus]|uniref:Fibrous sheath-interacting protein 2-like n=1 Tax=Clupea harengus TaxID=7950 RepID=A0A8M1KLV6_CLUHA|nr:fibrous sheath-interacting protein 2-like [Clupea harengus]